ncbi:hypothetical protein NP233_g6254 [Leucocoprinus birnbaumii]|uniref:Uncharacterized protein n=1 Tax=Leucocoprinus birnbaumii TaxID=56174 RepID=A0AAD5VTM4_9AGAR|nr:hypothetical protein NP233_g6254 [Leucocoprinus birnbaumii]
MDLCRVVVLAILIRNTSGRQLVAGGFAPLTGPQTLSIAVGGMGAVLYAIWQVSADREQRITQPDRFIPSMLWAKEYRHRKLSFEETKE